MRGGQVAAILKSFVYFFIYLVAPGLSCGSWAP